MYEKLVIQTHLKLVPGIVLFYLQFCHKNHELTESWL